MTTDIPGVPKGYRIVRVGTPMRGEQYLYDNEINLCYDTTDFSRCCVFVIVEPITPLEPELLILNEYLCWDGDFETGKPIDYTIIWSSSPVSAWENCIPTGVTRTINIKNLKEKHGSSSTKK